MQESRTDVAYDERPALTAEMEAPRVARNAMFAGAVLLIAAIGWRGLRAWISLSENSEQASNLWIIPLLAAFLIYERRKTIFSGVRFEPMALMVCAAGIGVYEVSRYVALTLIDGVALGMLGIMLAVAGAFVGCYGRGAGREAGFPLAFLLLAVPIPEPILNVVVRWLQYGSAAVVNLLFGVLRVPHVQDGLRFYLPGLDIEIASECSGIRSSFSLLVLTLLLCYIALRSTWRRLLLVATVIPLVLVKNGIRIVTICVLTIYVDPTVISGPLHRSGGFVFFGMALGVEIGLCWLLQRLERRTPEVDVTGGSQS